MGSQEDILRARAVVPDDVVHRAFEAETLVLKLGTGTYHGVDATGARTLELLRDTGGDVRATADRLASEYGADAAVVREDVLAFCERLVERGLLELR